jgi:hypothetical protein
MQQSGQRLSGPVEGVRQRTAVRHDGVELAVGVAGHIADI